ncbi:MAG: hypothetical protein Hyperionvirus13_22 [Hyperionvirus sp.]|uniref:Uncharacterized protein n=1 Tax=Hyperionvirus sp. TaxID=2487770 RepID=A0A3G5AET8_9VIRU|nr:MAG: hypothetical protein Hyperionvirus13_22 [Hyperionvirus sp.]
MEAEFHLLGATESYFRRTGVIIASICLSLTYIISASISVGMLIEKLGGFDMVCLWLATYIFFSLILLFLDISALYQKNDPERGTIMLAGYLFFCGLILLSAPSLYDSSGWTRNMYYISIGFFVFKFGYAIFNIILLANCHKGIPDHNISLRGNCR